MLLSMTGHGQASAQNDQVRVVAEIKTVNNRFLKTNINSDLDVNSQAKLETLIKQAIQRGSVNLRLKTQSLDASQEYRLNEPAIRSYWLQLSEIAENSQSINIESLLILPGVIADDMDDQRSQQTWPLVQQAVTQAIAALNEMRALEGGVMERDMQANLVTMGQHLEQIKILAPGVIESYSRRMTERINGLLEKYDVSIQATDIVKEVGVFAEKCDVSEETVRLNCHLEQFAKVVADSQSNGKKLDFLVQEMLRETNTIGSKANDFEVANHVVEIKTAIERIREMVQNVE